MAHYSPDQIQALISGFQPPDRAGYPELAEYTRDELYEDFFGGGGLYLAAQMARTLRLKPGDSVLDLGCGKGPTSIFLAKHFGAKVIAVDLWTSATFLNDKFTARGYRDRIVPLNLDITHELPFADRYFDAIFCLNSFNFYGGSVEFLAHLVKHLKPGGQICLGSEVLSDEFTAEQTAASRRTSMPFGCRRRMSRSTSLPATSRSSIRRPGGATCLRGRACCAWSTAPSWTTPTRSMPSWCATSTSTTSIHSTSISVCNRLNGAATTARARRCSC